MESPFQTNLFEFQNKLAVGKFVKANGQEEKGGLWGKQGTECISDNSLNVLWVSLFQSVVTTMFCLRLPIQRLCGEPVSAISKL